MKRRLGWAILLLASLQPASAPSAAAETVIHVGVPQPAFSFLPLDVGLQTGMFQKRGLQVDKLVANGSAKLHQALAAGSVDVAFGAGPEFGFLVKGSPELAVAATANAPADLAISVLEAGPIRSVDELKGKRVSVSSKGSLTEWAGEQLSRKQGWGPHGMNLVPLGSFTAQTAALKTHQIDAMITAAGIARRVEEEGSGRVLMTFENLVDDFHINVIYARTDFMRDHADALRAFLAGIFEAIRYEREHRPETIAIAGKVLDMSPTLAGRMYDTLMPAANANGRFHPKALEILAQAMVDMGELEQKPDMQKLLTEQFLPD